MGAPRNSNCRPNNFLPTSCLKMASNNITLDTQPRVNGEMLGQLQTGKEVIFLGSLERSDEDGRYTFLASVSVTQTEPLLGRFSGTLPY
jgi:hypothetical protein